MRKWRGVGATASLAITALLSASPSVGNSVEELQIAAEPASHYQGVPVTLTAAPLRDLYPSATKPLLLSLKNPYAYDLRITDIRGEVSRTSTSKCQTGNVTVLPYVGPSGIVVKANSRVTAGSLPVYMQPDAAQTCVGVTFTIRMTGTAKKVSR